MKNALTSPLMSTKQLVLNRIEKSIFSQSDWVYAKLNVLSTLYKKKIPLWIELEIKPQQKWKQRLEH